jgi:hypothetical protein
LARDVVQRAPTLFDFLIRFFDREGYVVVKAVATPAQVAWSPDPQWDNSVITPNLALLFYSSRDCIWVTVDGSRG